MKPAFSSKVETPGVSIVVSLFNKALFLSETIESVQSQTFNNWELIIVDDCSTDTSVEVLLPYLKADPRIHLFKNETNRGANYGRNLGLKMSKAPFIIFLDADDILTPFCCERRIEVMVESDNLDFSVFSMGVFHQHPGDNPSKWIPKSKNPLQDFLSHKLPWAICQPIWKKDFLLSIGGFDESFQRRQDVELHTRALFYPNVKFKQVADKADCFYRIDETRLNYNIQEFTTRSLNASLQYCNKFFLLAKNRNMERLLIGTIYKTYTGLLYYFATNRLNKSFFLSYESQLMSALTTFKVNGIKRFFFKISKFCNLIPIRIPGINWIIFRCVIL
jgi:glycosyltransferase involved in cell wall biosynthesis